MTERRSVSSGVHWEELAGYCRATRVDDRIFVSGTTASSDDGVVAVGDPAGQTRYVLDKIGWAIAELGGRLEDVVRTRIYITDIVNTEAIARVHGEVFGHVRPANTLVRADLVGDEFLVEIEAEAIVGAGDAL